LATSPDFYRVVFAWRGHSKVALGRLTEELLQRLIGCFVPRRSSTPSGRGEGSPKPAPRVHGARVEPVARFGESPFAACRTPMRAATTETKIYAEAYILGCSHNLGAPGTKSVQPLLRPSGISPARPALELFTLTLLGRHLARCLIPPTEALLARASIRATKPC
jgi:hypothetical protein